MIKWFPVLLLLFLPGRVWAVSDAFPPSVDPPTVAQFLSSPSNTYYCAPTGNNSTGDGSIGNPWIDLVGATGTIVAGDLIYFRGGAYPDYEYRSGQSPSDSVVGQNHLGTSAVRVHGTAQYPIVITNYPNEIVTYDSIDQTWCLSLYGDHQKLIGTKVGGEYGIQITGGVSWMADYMQVSGVEFISGTSNGGDLNPSMLTLNVNVASPGFTDATISHNYFHNSQHASAANRMAGIRFRLTQNTIVEYNLFKDNLELSDCAAVYFKDTPLNAHIRYNTFVNNKDGVEYVTQWGATVPADGLYVYGNLFYDVGSNFTMRQETGENFRFYNNVVLNIKAGGEFYYYNNTDEFYANINDTSSYYDNIIGGTGFDEFFNGNSENNLPTYFDYNLWYLAGDRNQLDHWSDQGWHTNAVTANNVVTYDAGTHTVTVADDYAGLGAGRYGGNIGGFTFLAGAPETATINKVGSGTTGNSGATVQ